MVPLYYTLSDAQFDQCRKALIERPKEEWPSEEMWERIALSVRIKQMENAEAELTTSQGSLTAPL